MINNFDLYDIAYALTIIRNHIREEQNTIILSEMIKVLEENNSAEDNQIRKAIALVEGIDYECWRYVYHNNVYVNQRILKNIAIYQLFIQLFESTITILNNSLFDQAHDLVDSYHCLPEIIADNHFTIPKSYWKTFVKEYRKKWNREYLRKEQKEFRKIQRHA